MGKRTLTSADDRGLASLVSGPAVNAWESSYADWIRVMRTYLRMTQVELAARAKIPQSHLAGIESGKTDPRVSTLKKIYEALYCRLSLEPKPRKPIADILRERARRVGLKRLKQSMGTMALEGQAPEAAVFRQLLEKQTDKILNSGERLHGDPDG